MRMRGLLVSSFKQGFAILFLFFIARFLTFYTVSISIYFFLEKKHIVNYPLQEEPHNKMNNILRLLRMLELVVASVLSNLRIKRYYGHVSS